MLQYCFYVLVFWLWGTQDLSTPTRINLSSVAKSCQTLCNPMDCSMPGFPVLHHLPELAQTQVHWIGDAIQPSHPLLPPLLPSIFPSIRVCWRRSLDPWTIWEVLVLFSCSIMYDSATPWTVAHQAPLSMGFPRQEYCCGLSFPPPGALPHAGSNPALAGRFFTTEPPGKPHIMNYYREIPWCVPWSRRAATRCLWGHWEEGMTTLTC